MRRVLLSLLVLAFDLRPADACSCDIQPHVLAPGPGAAGVPINAKIFLQLYEGPHRVALRGGGQTAVLETATLVAYGLGTITLATPPADLQPNTTYQIDVDASTALASFVTGDARDDTPPGVMALQSVTPEVIALPPNCGPASCNWHDANRDTTRFRFAYEPQDDTALALVEVYAQGAATRDVAPLRELVEVSRCGAYLAYIDPRATYCARPIAYDAAGNRTEGAEVCSATPTRCEPELQSTCNFVDECVAPQSGGCSASGGQAGWLALALLAFARRRA